MFELFVLLFEKPPHPDFWSYRRNWQKIPPNPKHTNICINMHDKFCTVIISLLLVCLELLWICLPKFNKNRSPSMYNNLICLPQFNKNMSASMYKKLICLPKFNKNRSPSKYKKLICLPQFNKNMSPSMYKKLICLPKFNKNRPPSM